MKQNSQQHLLLVSGVKYLWDIQIGISASTPSGWPMLDSLWCTHAVCTYPEADASSAYTAESMPLLGGTDPHAVGSGHGCWLCSSSKPCLPASQPCTSPPLLCPLPVQAQSLRWFFGGLAFLGATVYTAFSVYDPAQKKWVSGSRGDRAQHCLVQESCMHAWRGGTAAVDGRAEMAHVPVVTSDGRGCGIQHSCRATWCHQHQLVPAGTCQAAAGRFLLCEP
jgi:hypothetical protein